MLVFHWRFKELSTVRAITSDVFAVTVTVLDLGTYVGHFHIVA